MLKFLTGPFATPFCISTKCYDFEHFEMQNLSLFFLEQLAASCQLLSFGVVGNDGPGLVLAW